MATDVQLSPASLVAMELFQELPPSALETIAAAARLRRFPKDLRVFDQGGQDVRAHAVIEGGVRLVQSGRDGAQVIVRFIGPGEMFDMVGLFADRRYPAEAITLTDTIEASWGESELLDLMHRFPQLAINAIHVVARRLQEAQNRIRELSTQRAPRRLAHAVLRLAGQAGYTTVTGMAIEFPLRRKDLADMAGTTLHTASRVLTAWEKAGLVITCNQRLTIRYVSEIRRIAEDGCD